MHRNIWLLLPVFVIRRIKPIKALKNRTFNNSLELSLSLPPFPSLRQSKLTLPAWTCEESSWRHAGSSCPEIGMLFTGWEGTVSCSVRCLGVRAWDIGEKNLVIVAAFFRCPEVGRSDFVHWPCLNLEEDEIRVGFRVLGSRCLSTGDSCNDIFWIPPWCRIDQALSISSEDWVWLGAWCFSCWQKEQFASVHLSEWLNRSFELTQIGSKQFPSEQFKLWIKSSWTCAGVPVDGPLFFGSPIFLSSIVTQNVSVRKE